MWIFEGLNFWLLFSFTTSFPCVGECPGGRSTYGLYIMHTQNSSIQALILLVTNYTTQFQVEQNFRTDVHNIWFPKWATFLLETMFMFATDVAVLTAYFLHINTSGFSITSDISQQSHIYLRTILLLSQYSSKIWFKIFSNQSGIMNCCYVNLTNNSQGLITPTPVSSKKEESILQNFSHSRIRFALGGRGLHQFLEYLWGIH